MRAVPLCKCNALLVTFPVLLCLLPGCTDKPPISEATQARVRAYEQTKPSDTSPEARLRGYNQAHGAAPGPKGGP